MEYMLSTLDNPYNPHLQFDEWLVYDTTQGYNTCGLLARFTKSSDELSDEDQLLAIDTAMNEIIELNLFGNLIKVNKDYIPRKVDDVTSI